MIPDWVWRRATERVQAPSSTRYTERQLYYEVCRVGRPLPLPTDRQAGWAVGVGSLGALISWRQPRLALLAGLAVAAVGAAWLARRQPFTLAPPLAFADFQAELAARTARGDPPPGLVAETEPDPLPLIGREPDLTDYGLSRLLICQCPAIAAMLRANHFHLEFACPVVSGADGEPLPARYRAMLAHGQSSRVYLLHDASWAGLACRDTVAERLALPPTARLSPIGLTPAQARSLHLFAQRGALTPKPAPASLNLTDTERAWLDAGWSTEVAALRPVWLLRALRRTVLGAPPARRWSWFDPRRARSTGFLTWPAA